MAVDVTGQTILNDTWIHEIDGELHFARGSMYFEETSNPLASDVVIKNVNVPVVGSAWSGNHPQLVLVERIFSVTGIVPGSSPKRYGVKVELIYRKKRSKDAGNLSYATRGTSTLSQLEVVTDKNNDIVQVNEPGNLLKQKSVPTIVQAPRILHQRSRILKTDDPDKESASWIGHVNEQFWRGGGKGQWLCIHVDYNLIATGTVPTYEFNYEFEREQNTLDGWIYRMFWKSNDGTVPDGVKYPSGGEAGVGVTEFEYHRSRNFGDTFP